MTNVLVDRHHAGLFHSLQLMAARFGWTLYTPAGMEWWDEGYWSFGRGTFPDDRLAQQYLRIIQAPDGEFPDWPIAFVTLDEARTMEWTYVIATLQDNQEGFARFAREHGATYVLQVGNTGQWIDWHLDPTVLISSEVETNGRGLLYHQEMDPIAYSPPTSRHTAASFVNAMPEMGWCWELLEQARRSIPVGVYGIGCPDGNTKPFAALVEQAASVGWGWHDKAHGDGFGHVIHTWAAVGRPLVGHGSHYFGKMAGIFWRDMETCIDLDRHSVEEATAIIAGISEADHERMCRAIRTTFDEAVDYDAEAAAIADFLAVPVAA